MQIHLSIRAARIVAEALAQFIDNQDELYEGSEKENVKIATDVMEFIEAKLTAELTKS